MSREVPEWIGKTDDTAIPPRVRVRVFGRFGGTCFLSGRKIRAGEEWDCDHSIALINGGEHRESNLVPVLRGEHRKKTAADIAQKSKNYRVRAKFLGVMPKRSKIQSAGFRKSAPQRTASRPIERRT